MVAKIFNINIAIYEIINKNTYYLPYAIFKPESNSKGRILINFEICNHYNLLKLKGKEIEIANYEYNSKDIESKKFKNNLDNTSLKENIFFENTKYKKKVNILMLGIKKIIMMTYTIFYLQ